MEGKDTGFIVIGICIGLIFGMIIYLLYKDYLIQTCEFELVKENQPRNVVCRLQAARVIKPN